MSITKGTFEISNLDGNFNNLSKDINEVDIKLSELDQIILDLKNTCNRTQLMIQSSKGSDRTSLYKIVNTTMELLSTYYQTHQRFLELKYRYRKEQDDLTYKTAHFIQIELKKIDSAASASHFDVLDLLKRISSMDNPSKTNDGQPSLPPEIQDELNSIDDDEMYSLK